LIIMRKTVKRITAVALIGAMVSDPAVVHALVSPRPSQINSVLSPQHSALFLEQALTLKVTEMIKPLGGFLPIRRWQSQQILAMADRFGAHRTPRPARKPLIKGEVPQAEFETVKEELAKRLPALKPTLSKITRARYAAPISLLGAATLQPRSDQSGEWEMLVDEAYAGWRGLEVRKAFLLMHLAHETAELFLTPAGETPGLEMTRETAGPIDPGQHLSVWRSRSPTSLKRGGVAGCGR
jgi:hypothetical protein